MTTDNQMLDITILGRDYRVGCPPDEREALLMAVDFLDTRMGELAEKTKSSGERLAVMTALNLAHELLSVNLPGGFDMSEVRRRIVAMESRLDEALSQQESLF